MPLYLILIIVFVLFVTFAAILRRYRRCPSDKVLVIYGNLLILQEYEKNT